jgi:hypothetical protein
MNQKVVIYFLSFIILLGILLRFYHITDNRLIYYDEGMWLNHNRAYVHLVALNSPSSLNDFIEVTIHFIRTGFETAKPLWSFISSLRIFFAGEEAWYFTRMVSAVAGTLTVILTFFFAKRFLKSSFAGIVSATCLALLPSHVYYSQLGLQEAFSTLFFLLGFYLYLSSQGFRPKTFLAAFCFAFVFWSNYRMIVIPGLVLASELYLIFLVKQKADWQRYVWNTLAFFTLIFSTALINHGQSIYVSFGWMFHQANLAKGHFEWFNILSYPYFIFRLETFIFGGLFFGGLFFVFKKEWAKAFPLFMVFLQMALFSFSQEKANRFLCVMYPFMALAVGLVILKLFEIKNKIAHISLAVLLLVMWGWQIKKDWEIIHFTTDYEVSMQFIKSRTPGTKVLSAQSEVQKLFAFNNDYVEKVSLNHEYFLSKVSQGFHYLVLDPQNFVSDTDDKQRFTLKLAGYLSFILSQVEPLKVYKHFDQELLSRFVFDHNESLKNSLGFLRQNRHGELGMLRVYDADIIAEKMKPIILKSKMNK